MFKQVILAPKFFPLYPRFYEDSYKVVIPWDDERVANPDEAW